MSFCFSSSVHPLPVCRGEMETRANLLDTDWAGPHHVPPDLTLKPLLLHAGEHARTRLSVPSPQSPTFAQPTGQIDIKHNTFRLVGNEAESTAQDRNKKKKINRKREQTIYSMYIFIRNMYIKCIEFMWKFKTVELDIINSKNPLNVNLERFNYGECKAVSLLSS